LTYTQYTVFTFIAEAVQMLVPKLTSDARDLAVFRRQIAYFCAKYKARKVFLLCSGVLYG